MKKFFSILFIMFLGFTSLLFGCGEDRYENLTITIHTEQQRGADGSITLYVGDEPEDISVTIGGAPNDFNLIPSFSMSENIVKIGEINHMIDNGVRKTIEGIAPGQTVLTAYTSEGLKSATLKINVIKKAERIETKSTYKLAVLKRVGYETTIDTDSAITIYPVDSNQNTVKYSLESTGLEDVILMQDNKIKVLEGVSVTAINEFVIKAEIVNHLGEVNPDVEPTRIVCKLIDDISQDDIKAYYSFSETRISSSVLNNPITSTLILSKNYLFNNSVNVFIGVKTNENISITAPANTASSPVLISLIGTQNDMGVKYFIYRVQAIRYSKVKALNFDINVVGYENVFDFNTEINVECQLYIKTFEVNEEAIVEDGINHHDITLYTNEQTSGTRLKIAVSDPKEILAEDARFKVALYNVNTGEMVSYDHISNYFSITNVANNSRLSDTFFMKEVTFNVKLQAGALDVDDSGLFKLVVEAEAPLTNVTKATTSIVINIVEGIKTLDSITYGGETYTEGQININFEQTTDPLEVTLNCTPTNPTAYSTLYAESSNESIFTVRKVDAEDNKFLIVPIAYGEATVRFGSKNLTDMMSFRVSVYEDIEDFFVSIDEYSQSKYIGTSTVVDRNLESAVIKVNEINSNSAEIKLYINPIPTTAKYYETSFAVRKVEIASGEETELTSDGTYFADDNFSFNIKKENFKFLRHNPDFKYIVSVILTNYDGTRIVKEFEVSSYIPITTLNMSLTEEILYNPKNLGYFDRNNAVASYTKTQAFVVTNADATFGGDIRYEVVANGALTENLLIQDQNNKELFVLNENYPITKYPQKVYITAYAIEFGKRIETTKQIVIHDPVTVDSLAVEGDINGDIVYFRLGVDLKKTIKVTLEPSINLFNSNVKWVQYAEGTTNVLDFADNNGGLMTAVDTSDAIFAINSLGGNRFEIEAVKAGNARLILIPEDKITNVNGSHYVYNEDVLIELFVSVADGTRENPYHIANYSDFKSVINAMDKYYVLTSNIVVEDNWKALGYDTRTPLTGGINGLYSRIVDAAAGTRYSIQYQITNVSYAVAMPTNIVAQGLIYSLGDAEHPEATLENLIVKYSYIQAEFSESLTFGGLVAINKGVINNCQVHIPTATIVLNGMISNIGGLVGENYGIVDNSDIDNGVNIKMNINIKNENIMGINYGGLVGKMYEGTLNGSQKDYTEVDLGAKTYGDQGYDIIQNITFTTAEGFSDASRQASAVGGVVGNITNNQLTKAAVNNFMVKGNINAEMLNKVGGIVGDITGTLFIEQDLSTSIGVTLFNNTNTAKLTGHSYVGGVVAKALYASFSYCSAENYKESQETARQFIVGKNYVGGFAGELENSNIDHSFFVTYFENAEGFGPDGLTERNSDVVCLSLGDMAESRVGGFIASLSQEDTNVITSVAFIGNIFITTNATSNCAGFIGSYNGVGTLTNFIVRGYVNAGVSTVFGATATRPANSTYYAVVNQTGEVPTIDLILDKSGDFDDDSVWATDANVNDGLPYLLDEEGNILFAFLPIEISVTIIPNGDGVTDDEEDSLINDGYLYIEDPDLEVVVLYLNNLSSGELSAEQLLELNTYDIDFFANLEITPLTLKTSRLVISSSNSSIVKVSEGSLIAVSEGYVRITISSKLNADYKASFVVVVAKGFNGYNMYESSNFSTDTLVKDDISEPIQVVENKIKALYENIVYNREYNGDSYSLQTSSNVYVKYVLENDDYKDSFIINTSWQVDAETHNEVAVSTLTSIFGQLVKKDAEGKRLPPVRVTATPYVTYNYFGENYTFYYDFMETSFFVDIINGATNITFESNSTNVEITQLQSFVFGVIMDTDAEDDAIEYYVTYNGEIIDLNTEEGVIVLKKSLIEGDGPIVDENGEIVKIKDRYTVSFDNTEDIITQSRTFYITFYSKLVPTLESTISVTVVPQNIVSADFGLYSDTNDYNANKDGTEKFIYNGQTALLTVEIYPDFSLFDSFDISYTSDTGSSLSLSQLKYNKNATATDNPFEDYKDSGSQFIQNYGIRVRKTSGEVPLLGSGSGIYSYSKIFYFSMLVGTNVPDLTTYTVRLVFYSEGKVVEPRDIMYTFQALQKPAISLDVADSSLNKHLPIGTKNEIKVTTANFTGDISWSVEILKGATSDAIYDCNPGIDPPGCGKCIDCLNANYALLDSLIPTIGDDGKYYITIPKDNLALIGNIIRVRADIQKSENNATFNASDELDIEVTLFTVTEMKVAGLSFGALKLPIYTPFSLEVNLTAIYSEEVEYNDPIKNPNNYSIKNIISKLRDQISMAPIWKVITDANPEGVVLVKNSKKLYNSAFECIAYGDYFALYGSSVEIISNLTASAEIGYENGVPVFIEGESPIADRSIYTDGFTVSFTYQNDIKNPIPIETAADFLAMEEGKDYRLIKDILLENYTPLSTRILSLDGNGKTIYISSFASGLAGQNYGLFESLSAADVTMEATMIYNVNVYYIANPEITATEAAGGNYEYSYAVPEIKNQVILDMTHLTEFNFGGIAGINNGIITNCCVQGLVKVASNSDALTACNVGGLVGQNNGFISNSKVINYTMTSSGDMGGVAGLNTNKISSTFTDEVELNNDSTNTQLFYTGGFVCRNAEGAQIFGCYAQGKRAETDESLVNTYNSLVTSGTAGGFVYLNEGSINDSYSNVAINASAFSAGFVFVNEEEGVVNNCYSISRVAFNSKASSPFTGIGKSEGVTVVYEGSITNCFFLDDAKYNNFNNEPATGLELIDFDETDAFGTFNFRHDTTNPVEAEGYTWYMAGGKPRLTQTDIQTNSIYTYSGKTKHYKEGSQEYFKFRQIIDQTNGVYSGKWFAYSPTTGYDESKELVITRRATLAYFIKIESSEEVKYYFKQAFNADGTEKFVTFGTGENQIKKLLYSTAEDGTKNNLYYLADDRSYMVNKDNIDDKLPVYFEYFDEVYTEENGTIQGVRADASKSIINMWKNINTGLVSYFVNDDNPADGLVYSLFQNNSMYDNVPTRYIMSIEINSVLYKDGGESNLVDLSVDDENKCDLTYIPTLEELGMADIINPPHENAVYGGGYSYRKLESIQYHYASNGVGQKTNPYLIYDTVSYNTYFADKFSNNVTTYNEREYYRFVADIDFGFKQINTSNRILYGFVEGNAMSIKNITITYVSGETATEAFGLFAQAYNSMVNNLTLEVMEIASSAHTYVGGLVGWARTDDTTDGGAHYFNGYEITDYAALPEYLARNYLNNIVIKSVPTLSSENIGLVLGRNFAGGLVGYATGDTKINEIESSVNVNAVYVVDKNSDGKYVTYQRVDDSNKSAMIELHGSLGYSNDEWTYYNNRRLSYAGMIIGVLDCDVTPESESRDRLLAEIYQANNLTTKGIFTGAGFIIGGSIGLVAHDNLASNLNVIVEESQSIRGTLYAGGLVGENRGKIALSTIAYATDAENQVTLVTTIRKNATFFNNNIATVAIGGIVGFNNGGEVNNSISHVDVRNPSATVAGGAVGRSIKGSYDKVIVSGSVRAKSIMGGFVGTVNTTYTYIAKDALGAEEQVFIYPVDNTVNADTVFVPTDSFANADTYISCIAANNWYLNDYPFLTEKQNVKRVTGGFIGSEHLTTEYYINLDKLDEVTNVADTKPSYMKIYSTFDKCFYTNSLYYGSTGVEVAPAFYMPIAYISSFDEVRLYTSNYESNTLFNYMYPFIGTNELNQSSPNSESIVGMSHYEMTYGTKKEYKDDFVTSYTSSQVVVSAVKPVSQNYLETRANKIYGSKTSYVEETNNYKYTYSTSNDYKKGFSFVVETEENGQVKSKTFTVIEKYFIYKEFYASSDFTIANNFLNTLDSNDYTAYPKVNIKSSSFDWRTYAGTEFNESEDGYYLIETANDLAALSYLVETNANDDKHGGKYASYKYRLMNDIDLTGKAWNPIGTSSNKFKGEFDGNGKAIKCVSVSNYEYAGVFGYVENAKIYNLICSGGIIEGTVVAGGIVAQAKTSEITNCINTNTVIGATKAAGVIAESISCTLTDLYNKGQVIIEAQSATTYSGGILATSTGNSISYTIASLVSNNKANSGNIVVNNQLTSYTAAPIAKGIVYLGGLVGYSVSDTITTADFIYNCGDIVANINAHNAFIGGVFGAIESCREIAKLRNNGNITVNSSNTFATKSDSDYSYGGSSPIATMAIGGIIGDFDGKNTSTQSSTLGLFSNNGNIYYDNQKSSKCVGGVGGIIGRNSSSQTTLTKSYNTGSIEIRVGSAGKTNINLGVGGIIGLGLNTVDTNVAGSIDNSYNMGNIQSSGSGGVWSGGIYGISALVVSDQYALGNGTDVLNNNKAVSNVYMYVSNCYNVGTITGANDNEYGLGAILGYGVGARCQVSGTNTVGYNYYLAGSAKYAYASYEVETLEEPDENGATEIVTKSFQTHARYNYEQRTGNTLKIKGQDGVYFGGSADAWTNWEQKVETWYPTLKENYEILLWSNKTEGLSVEGETYTIGTAEQLAYVSYTINNGLLDSSNIKFKLIANIDMANRYFTPIGNVNYPFKGEFNGNGFSIKNLTIDSGSAILKQVEGGEDPMTIGSLFGYADGAKITNLGLVSPTIYDVDYSSGICYRLINNGLIEYCYIDSFEVPDPGLGETSIYKVGSITGYEAVAGIAIELVGSSITKSYVNVPLGTQVSSLAGKSYVEYVSDFVAAGVGPSATVAQRVYNGYLAGFVNALTDSTIDNSYIGSGVSELKIFTHFNNDVANQSLLTSSKFNKFVNIVNNSAIIDPNDNIEGYITHCFNLTRNKIPYYHINAAGVIQTAEDVTLTTSVGLGGDITPTAENLKSEDWDVIDIWSYEYSLLGDDPGTPATIRGLGPNWYNTECNDLILRNAVGDKVTDKDSLTDLTGVKQYFNYYEVTTPEELAWIARMINTGRMGSQDSSKNKYVIKLMNDIDLSGRTWTPIGTLDNPFGCKFDFNGYEISNIVIDTANISFGGLFGYTQDAVITNGFISNSYINIDITSEEYNAITSMRSLYIGNLVGKGHNTQISDIVVEGNVVGYSKYNVYVGGLAGGLTYGKSTSGQTLTSSVTNVQVLSSDEGDSEALIPQDYRLHNSFGIDEVLPEAEKDNYLRVNVGGFSNSGNSYVGGVVGHISGKFTQTYSTRAEIQRAYSYVNIVSYSHSDISRTYAGGIAGYMTENSYLNIVENVGDIKTATYGFDYLGGIAGMIDASSEIANASTKGHLECSQFASILSYVGGVGGYLRGGSKVSVSANFGSTYKNVDSTKIFSAGAFGYVEKDVTGAMPTVANVVYVDDTGCYEDAEGDTIPYYGDGQLVSESGVETIVLVVDLQDDRIKDAFSDSSIWNVGSGDVYYSTTYEITYDSAKVAVFYAIEDEFSTNYALINSGSKLPMGTKIIIVTKEANTKISIEVDGIDREYALTHYAACDTMFSVMSSINKTSDGTQNAIVLNQIAGGLQEISSVDAD